MHVITDLDVGGAEIMLARLLGAADRRRFRMSVASLMAPGAIAAELLAQGIEVHSLGLSRGRIDPRGIWRLVRLLRTTRVDVLQSWLYHADLLGLIAARLAGVRALAWNLRCSDMELARYSRLSVMVVKLLARLSRVPTGHRELGCRAGGPSAARISAPPWSVPGAVASCFRPISNVATTPPSRC